MAGVKYPRSVRWVAGDGLVQTKKKKKKNPKLKMPAGIPTQSTTYEVNCVSSTLLWLYVKLEYNLTRK